MAELKIGGNDVVKIMYGDQEIGGATKLEPGTILYMPKRHQSIIQNVHLSSTTKNWNNINGIKVIIYNDDLSTKYVDDDIPSDDFKTLNRKYQTTVGYGDSDLINISTSIVDGEYRLNISSRFYSYIRLIKAL